MVTLIEHLALYQGHIILEIGLLFFFGDNTSILNHMYVAQSTAESGTRNRNTQNSSVLGKYPTN